MVIPLSIGKKRQIYTRDYWSMSISAFFPSYPFIQILANTKRRKRKIAGNIGDYDTALQYYDSAYEHYLRFMDWSKGANDHDHFQTKLLRNVSSSTLKVYRCEPALFENAISAFPEMVFKFKRPNPSPSRTTPEIPGTEACSWSCSP